MTYLDDILTDIITRRSQGIDTRAISMELNMSSESIERYEGYFRKLFNNLLSGRGRKRKTSKTLTQMPNPNFVTLLNYYSSVPPKNTKLKRIDRFKEAAAEGCSALQILDKTNTAPFTAYQLSRKAGIELQQEKVINRNEIKVLRHRLKKINNNKDTRINKLIRRGLSLEQIGEAFGYTNESIRQLIVGSGQHDYWRMSRQFYKYTKGERNLYETRQEIIELLKANIRKRVESLNDEGQWAEKQALKYKTSLKNLECPDSIPIQKLIKLFETYQRAEQSGERVSLKELGDESGMSHVHVSRILSRVGLESFFWKCEHKPRLTSEQKRTIRSLAMNSRDISFFSGYSQPTISKINSLYSGRILEKFGGKFGGKTILNYRIASQVYEAQDAGFNEPEICELLDRDERVIQYAIEHRPKVEKTIIKAIRVFHPDKKVNKPYL